MVVVERKSREGRLEAVLDAALEEFGTKGYHGGSTEDIARRAGISQPYVFRLFGTKRDLFEALVRRCFAETLTMFEHAAEGLRGMEALEAIGASYMEQLLTDQLRLRAQMQAYSACDDPVICTAVRQGYGELVGFAERVSGLDPSEISAFFAKGMLLNVIASMGLTPVDLAAGSVAEPWAVRLLEGCKPAPHALP